MSKILIAYFSAMGNTEKMAEFIAEGVRMSGGEPVLKKITSIKSEAELEGFDGYLFGCPTYHRDMTENFKTFLFVAKKAGLAGKAGGAFGSNTHSGDAPKIIFDTMENVFEMKMTDLGAFLLHEKQLAATEGTKACQDYGKAFGAFAKA